MYLLKYLILPLGVTFFSGCGPLLLYQMDNNEVSSPALASLSFNTTQEPVQKEDLQLLLKEGWYFKIIEHKLLLVKEENGMLTIKDYFETYAN